MLSALRKRGSRLLGRLKGEPAQPYGGRISLAPAKSQITGLTTAEDRKAFADSFLGDPTNRRTQ